jgi:Spy/CpxP family protein refolding chaperone
VKNEIKRMTKLVLLNTIICAGVLILTMPTLAAEQKAAAAHLTPEQVEANYTRAIEGRTGRILATLELTDTNQADSVHDIIMAQWRALRAWHSAHDAELHQAMRRHDTNKVALIHDSLKALHNQFIARLSEHLTPEQVEKVKDGMTYDTVEVTYRAYCEIVPNLTASDKAEILKLLKEAREEAMDCGSSKEKALVFKRYKGKINNYLNAHGHDVGRAYREWEANQKAKSAEENSSSSK